MLQLFAKHEVVMEIFQALTTFTGVQIILYDADNRCRTEFTKGKTNSAYCLHRQRAPAFLAACEACEAVHLAKARQSRSLQMYRCHHGLTEVIVPLHDAEAHYLVAVGFGQIRLPGQRLPPRTDARSAQLYRRLPLMSLQRVRQLASVLAKLGAYMVQNHIIQFRKAPWAVQLDHFVRSHSGERITIPQLAKDVGRSASFVSHRFRKETGLSPHRYVQRERMARAKELLDQGQLVKEVAVQLGYSDAFHFSKVFKAHHGLAPSHYRAHALTSSGD